MTDDERSRFQAVADQKGISLPELLRLGAEVIWIEEARRYVASH